MWPFTSIGFHVLSSDFSSCDCNLLNQSLTLKEPNFLYIGHIYPTLAPKGLNFIWLLLCGCRRVMYSDLIAMAPLRQDRMPYRIQAQVTAVTPLLLLPQLQLHTNVMISCSS